MYEDLAIQIWQKNKKILSYGEIDHLLQILQKQKPQFKKISFFGQEHKWNSGEDSDELTPQGVIILLRVYDEKENINKSLKIFFIDHFYCSLFVEEIFHLFQRANSLIRKDLILQIFDVYHLKFNDKCNIYFVIEQEDVYSNLNELYQLYKQNEKQINEIMQTAINYCQECTTIKLKLQSKKLSFPQQFLKYFYFSNTQNGDLKIKLNVLANEIFTNPNEEQEYLYDSYSSSSASQSQYKIEDISNQLSKLLINLKKLEVIKSEDLIQTIKSQSYSLLKHHDLQLFEIICQHPKYDDFELIEYDEEFVILAAKIQGQRFYLKFEKFSCLKEAEQQLNEYHVYYDALNNMLMPIENIEIIMLENNFVYLIVEEKIIPYQSQIQKQKQKHQAQNEFNIFKSNSKKEEEKNDKITYYNTLEFIVQNQSDAKIDQLRILQIIVQLIRFIYRLHKNQIYHGKISASNIIVFIPIQFNQKNPDIYFQNPLFLRQKAKQKANIKDFENDKDDISLIIFSLIHSIYSSVIDVKALKQFKVAMYSYFDQLHMSQDSQQECQMQNENSQIFFYIKKLEDLFGVFEQIYKFQLDDKHVKLNKKWMISVNKFNDAKRQFGYYVFYNNYEQDEANQFEQDEFYSDSSSDSSYGIFKSKYDQCNSPHVFELNIEKIKYDFESHIDSRGIDKIQSMSKNNNLKSLSLKGYKFQNVYSIFHCIYKDQQDQNSRVHLENLLKNCSKLKKLKLEVTMDECDLFDLSGIKNMKELEFIRLKFWSFLNYSLRNQEKGTEPMKQQFCDFLEIFQVIRNIKVIDIHPFGILISSFQHIDFDWFFEKQKLVYDYVSGQLIKEPDENKQIKYDSISVENFNTDFYLNDRRVQQLIRNKDEEVNDLNRVVNNFYLAFQNQEQEIVGLSKQKLIQKLSVFLNENKYFSCTAFRMLENDKQLLVLEFQNIFDISIGNFQVYLQFNGQTDLAISSFKCKSQERFKCCQHNQFQIFKVDLIHRWVQCEYETNIKEELFNSSLFQVMKTVLVSEKTQLEKVQDEVQKQNQNFEKTEQIAENKFDQQFQNKNLENKQLKQLQIFQKNQYVSAQSCRHLDSMLYQIAIYQNQLNLQKLTIYFDYCDTIFKNLTTSNDFFKFSYYNQNSLLELNIKIYFFEEIKQIKPVFLNNFRRHIEEAKSLVKIAIDANQLKARIIKRHLCKLKRLVCVGYFKAK
ncbi:hypothetical protein ABPG72_015166 [Tetrahymena utriculariae]